MRLEMRLALRLALREMRCDLMRGLAGLRIFLACLALGVAGIAGIGSVIAALQAGLDADAAKTLGGDLEFTLPQRDPPADAIAWLAQHGRMSEALTVRGMVRPLTLGKTQLVAVKAVDGAYPLYGAVLVSPALPLAQVLEVRDGVPGMAADRAVFDQLGLHLGDTIRLGTGIFALRAVLDSEPDGAGSFEIGAPILISIAGFKHSGLDLPGTLAAHAWRLRLDRPASAAAILAAANIRFPAADWQAREARTASPLLTNFINQADTMMELVGLAALLLGGIGVAQAIAAHLARRRSTIAILKCLGAPSRLIVGIYAGEIMTLALLGIAAGTAAGGALPYLLGALLGDRLPIPIDMRLYPAPLLFAAAYGLLIASAALAWSLAGIGRIPAAVQLRGPVAPPPAWRDRQLTLLPLLALAGLMIFRSGPQSALAAKAGLAIIVALTIFALIGYAILGFARILSRAVPVGRGLALRLGLANLSRPGAATPAAVLALGLGLSVLTAITVIDDSLEHMMRDAVPPHAPSLFFIDIQPDQTAPFAALARSQPGINGLDMAPSLRTRVVRLNDVRLDAVTLDPGTRRIIDGDRGLTYTARLPVGSRVVSGAWWPADYQGPPLLSLDADLARDLHLRIGDTMTLNIAGRELTARIANTRHIDWSSFGINFLLVMAPGTLEPAPQTHIATVHADSPQTEERFSETVSAQFPNVSAIPISVVIAKLTTVLDDLTLGIRVLAGLLLAAGLLVLASVEAAARERRIDDAGLLQILGAGRPLLAVSYLIEYGLLGILTSLAAGGIGILGAWLVVTRIMQIPWILPLGAVALIPACVLPLTMVIGFAGTWGALTRARRDRARG